MHIPSYPSIYAIGHKAIADIFSGPVLVEEKVDGSQFSMRREDGQLFCRSKGKDIVVDAPEKMFSRAVEVAKSLDLHEGWTYRCEYLEKPKHNTLAYNCTPIKHLVIFDIETGTQEFLPWVDKTEEAERIGLEYVPAIHLGTIESADQLFAMLDRESFLGGCKIEGVVVKNYSLFTADKKIAIGKFVSEAFKEKHKTAWKASNPGTGDVLTRITEQLRTEARWRKAVQHLREAGQLFESPKDIGALIKEVQADITKEESDWIAEQLLKYAVPHILRGTVRGLPEWYKEELAKSAFAPSAL